MLSVDVFSNSVGEHLVAFSALCLKIENWTDGAVGWGIASCVLGFAFLYREPLAKLLAPFYTAFRF